MNRNDPIAALPPLSRRRRHRRLTALAVAAAFGLVALASRGAGDGQRPLAAAEVEIPSCRHGAACPDPGPAGWGARIEVLLEARAPGMVEEVRRRVARALVEESRAAGLDPLLVAALIDVESGFDSGARSWAGAQGLMQVLPSTIAREAARSGMAHGDPSDPVFNVRLGVRYFGRLVAVFGREDWALMAYNAGPNRIGDYLQHGRIPERFRRYPALVFAEQRRLRQAFGIEPAAALAMAAAPRLPAP